MAGAPLFLGRLFHEYGLVHVHQLGMNGQYLGGLRLTGVPVVLDVLHNVRLVGKLIRQGVQEDRLDVELQRNPVRGHLAGACVAAIAADDAEALETPTRFARDAEAQ